MSHSIKLLQWKSLTNNHFSGNIDGLAALYSISVRINIVGKLLVNHQIKVFYCQTSVLHLHYLISGDYSWFPIYLTQSPTLVGYQSIKIMA